MLQLLANLLKKPVEQVCPFMYSLTLKRFSEIMNPKCAGWNFFRVPLSRPDTCTIYNGIFDLEGDIRNPISPPILRILRMILRHFLNLPCQGMGVKRPPKIDDMFTGGQQDCFDMFKRRSKRGRRGKMGGAGGGGEGDDGDGGDGDMDDAMAGLDGDGDGDDDDDSDSEFDKKGKGKGDEEEVEEISDNVNRFPIKVKRKKQVEEEEEEYVPPAKKKAKPKKKKKYKGSERRYMGKMIPVLMHEPFDESKPWTWVRRHPLQARVLEGKEIGRSKVHRYKRETLEQQMARAQREYSVHSVYSVGRNKSVLETAMFGHGRHKKKHHGMAKPYDYVKLREVVPEEVEVAPVKKKPKKA